MANITFTIPSVLNAGSGEKKSEISADSLQDAFVKISEILGDDFKRRVLEADNPDGEFRVFQPRERDLEYNIAHYNNSFYILTNKELETMVDTNDEWIVSRTGVKERRILKGAGKGSSDLGAGAIKGLLAKLNIAAEDVDLIICATATPDMIFPSTACIIADKVGAKKCFCLRFDGSLFGVFICAFHRIQIY